MGLPIISHSTTTITKPIYWSEIAEFQVIGPAVRGQARFILIKSIPAGFWIKPFDFEGYGIL